jgi:cupin-like protein
MHATLPSIPEFAGLDVAAIRETVLARARPAVLRGLVRDWPAVRRGLDSAAALVGYLRGFDNGTPIDAIMTAPEERGRIFYNASMSGFNYVRNRLPLTSVAEQVLRYSAFPKPPAVAAQSALLRDCAPGFAAANHLAVLDESVQPRIWLGNAITTPAHFDEYSNLACAVAGRRRFTLFPPEQIANLYIGPLDFAPTGAPISMVTISEPDFTRFPKFREALAHAMAAELEPGDAIFIPPTWWHHVESLQPFNMLVNYWWHANQGQAGRTDSAFDSLMHSILNLRQLPPETRSAWAAIYAHFVFGADSDVTGHIPVERHGLLGQMPAERIRALRIELASRLQKGGDGST